MGKGTMSDQGPLSPYTVPEFVPPEHVPPADLDEPPRPTDFLFLIPLLVIGLGLGMGWYLKWKDTVPPLPRDWSPACNEEVPAWQLFSPPAELQVHSAPGEWILGPAEVAVRWEGLQSSTPTAVSAALLTQAVLTTSNGEPSYITTLVGNAGSSHPLMNALDAGLTSNTVWFLGEVGTSGTILELAQRGTGSRVVTPLRLPPSLPDESGTQSPVFWLARDYGDSRLLLIGCEGGHASPEFAELRVISLPSGKVESTSRISLFLHGFFGEVDETTGTILLTRTASTPPEYWRVDVASGVRELLPEAPGEVVGLAGIGPKTDETWYQRVPKSFREQTKMTGIGTPIEAAVVYYARPGVALDMVIDKRHRGSTMPLGLGRQLPWIKQYDPPMKAHPQEVYLRPEIGWEILAKKHSVGLGSAVLQSASSTTSKPVELDPNTMAALQATVAKGILFPMKLHPISTEDVLVTQLVRPGNRTIGNKSGMVRLGWLDQQTLAITWLAWWPLPRQEFGGERQVDCTFAMTGDIGWLLVAGTKDNGEDITPDTVCYVAQKIDNFDDWLDDRLTQVSMK